MIPTPTYMPFKNNWKKSCNFINETCNSKFKRKAIFIFFKFCFLSPVTVMQPNQCVLSQKMGLPNQFKFTISD